MTTTDPETVYNAFRLANYSVENGDKVSVFLLGKGVELDQIQDQKFDVQGIAKTFLGKGGKITVELVSRCAIREVRNCAHVRP